MGAHSAEEHAHSCPVGSGGKGSKGGKSYSKDYTTITRRAWGKAHPPLRKSTAATVKVMARALERAVGHHGSREKASQSGALGKDSARASTTALLRRLLATPSARARSFLP